MITYRSAKIGFCPATKCSLLDSCHAANKKISRRLAICINLNLNPRLLYLESNTTFYHFATMLLEIQKTFIVPRLFEEKRRDIVFGFPSFRPSFRPSVLPSFRPPIGVCTLCAQLLLQFYSDSFETLQMSSSCFEDVHVVWI